MCLEAGGTRSVGCGLSGNYSYAWPSRVLNEFVLGHDSVSRALSRLYRLSGIFSEGDKRDSKHGLSVMTLLRRQRLGLGRGRSKWCLGSAMVYHSIAYTLYNALVVNAPGVCAIRSGRGERDGHVFPLVVKHL